MYKRTFITLLLAGVSFLSCENETLSYFPYALVNFKVNLTSGHDNGTLTQPGGYYIKEKKLASEEVGYKGVLVYRTYQGDEFRAFDIGCSNCLSGTISAPNGHIVKCNNSNCASEFNLETYGTATSGPAKERERRLQSYQANQAGNFVVVTN